MNVFKVSLLKKKTKGKDKLDKIKRVDGIRFSNSNSTQREKKTHTHTQTNVISNDK